MSEKISRRTFLKRSTVAGATAGMLLATKTPGYAQTDKSDENTLIGSLIDLTKCDGCAAYDTPLCVTACKQKNEHRFPQPQKPIKDYWPQKSMKTGPTKKTALIASLLTTGHTLKKCK